MMVFMWPTCRCCVPHSILLFLNIYPKMDSYCVPLVPVEWVWLTTPTFPLRLRLTIFLRELAGTARLGANKDNSHRDQEFTRSLLSPPALTAYTWWNGTGVNIGDLKLLKSRCSLASCCEEERVLVSLSAPHHPPTRSCLTASLQPLSR